MGGDVVIGDVVGVGVDVGSVSVVVVGGIDSGVVVGAISGVAFRGVISGEGVTVIGSSVLSWVLLHPGLIMATRINTSPVIISRIIIDVFFLGLSMYHLTV